MTTIINLTPAQRLELINNMRDWVKDCQWREDFDDTEIDAMTDSELIRGINANYSGGINQFIQDSNL